MLSDNWQWQPMCCRPTNHWYADCSPVDSTLTKMLRISEERSSSWHCDNSLLNHFPHLNDMHSYCMWCKCISARRSQDQKCSETAAATLALSVLVLHQTDRFMDQTFSHVCPEFTISFSCPLNTRDRETPMFVASAEHLRICACMTQRKSHWILTRNAADKTDTLLHSCFFVLWVNV